MKLRIFFNLQNKQLGEIFVGEFLYRINWSVALGYPYLPVTDPKTQVTL